VTEGIEQGRSERKKKRRSLLIKDSGRLMRWMRVCEKRLCGSERAREGDGKLVEFVVVFEERPAVIYERRALIHFLRHFSDFSGALI
jgi:hypothetical protein